MIQFLTLGFFVAMSGSSCLRFCQFDDCCFFSHFCFQVLVGLFVFLLPLLLLIFLCFFNKVFQSLYCIAPMQSSMLANPLPLFFSSLSVSSFRCKALCINFLVLWSICLSSSIVHLKNGSEYLTRRTAQAFFPLMRFLLQSLVSWRFFICLRYTFLFFSFISTCLMILLLLLFYTLQIFHTSFNKSVTASLLSSSKLFKVFLLILTVLWFWYFLLKTVPLVFF